jgi:hypothetical protein
VCTVTLVTVAGGVYRHVVKNDLFWPGSDNAEVTVRVSVEKGSLQVWLEDWQRNKTLIGVEPGQTAELKGVASVTYNGGARSFSVYFEPLDETKRVENVRAEIRYDTHHTVN